MCTTCYRRCRKNLFRNIIFEIIADLPNTTTPLPDEQQNFCHNDLRVIGFTKIKKTEELIKLRMKQKRLLTQND